MRRIVLLFLVSAGCHGQRSQPNQHAAGLNLPPLLAGTYEHIKPNFVWESTGQADPLDPAPFYSAVEAQMKKECPPGDMLCPHGWVAIYPEVSFDFTRPTTRAEADIWMSRWRRVADFYNRSSKPFEGFRKALEAVQTPLNQLLKSDHDWKKHNIQQVGDPSGEIRHRLIAAAGYKDDALRNELLTTREQTRALKQIYDAYQASVNALLPDYQAIGDGFIVYRNAETQAAQSLKAIATSGSTADIAGLASLKQQLNAVSLSESDQADDLVRRARRLERQLAYADETYSRELVPYADFMPAHGFKRLDLVNKASAALLGMAAYAEARERQMGQVVTRLVDELHKRTTALVAQAADAATRGAVAQAAILNASAQFVKDVNAQTDQLFAVPPRSRTLSLQFLTGARDRMASYLGLEVLCSGTRNPVPSWMESGCAVMKPNFGTAHNYLTQKLPALIRLQVALLRKAGVDEGTLKDTEAKLAAGDLKGAVESHDVAVFLSDGGAS